MFRTRIATTWLVMATLAPIAFGQEKGPVPPNTETLTFDAVAVKPEELPKDVKIVEGVHCAANQPAAFFKTPSILDLADEELRKKILANEALAKMAREFPKPKRSACQSFQSDGGVAGSVLVFEYESAERVQIVSKYLTSYLWGKPGGPSDRYPESMYLTGPVVVIVSFPQGDPAAEWFKGRLRKRFRIPAPRWSQDRLKLYGPISAIAGHLDGASDAKVKEALKSLADNEALVGSDALAHFLAGELATHQRDYALSGKSYRRALELHDTGEDPMEPTLVWACLDGLGGSLVLQKKPDEAIPVLERAVQFGRAAKYKNWSAPLYNLACAQAMRKRFDLSLAALKDAIGADPKWKESAKTDDDFAEARKRPEFVKLLAD